MQDIGERLLQSAMDWAAEAGWHSVTVIGLAARADVPAVDVYRRFTDKAAVLAGLMRHIDERVLADGPVDDAEDGLRDRLFEVLMRRFDALRPYRAGLRMVLRDLRRASLDTALAGPALLRSMAWMAGLAGMSTDGVVGRLRLLGLVSIYLTSFAVFVEDDTEDLSRTMAEVDHRLRRGMEFLDGAGCCRRRGHRVAGGLSTEDR